MPFNFTNETLFAGAFILIVVIFIQYMVYLKLKKIIKLELGKKSISSSSQQNRYTEPTQQKQNPTEQVSNQVIKQIDDDETYDVDTPDDEDADSYVNPIHSEKNIDDTDE